MLKINAESGNRTRFHQVLDKLLKNEEYHYASPSRRLEMFKKELEQFDNKKYTTCVLL